MDTGPRSRYPGPSRFEARPWIGLGSQDIRRARHHRGVDKPPNYLDFLVAIDDQLQAGNLP